MRQDSRASTLAAMAASLEEDFQGDLVRIVVLGQLPPELADAPWLQAVPADSPHLAPFRDCLADGEPLCGRLQRQKNALLYAAQAEEVGSSALLPLPFDRRLL